jgi:transcription elongation factor GreB
MDSNDSDLDEDEPIKGTLYITAQGAEKMRAEFKQLLTIERPKVTAEVSWAASLGDRSENAEYIYGKKRLREIDKRIHFLQRRIEKLAVVEPQAASDKSKIYFGATVVLENQDDASTTTYQLVGPDETDLKVGKISVDSPVGRALMGKKVNDAVLVRRPKGEIELLVLAIVYK